MNDLVPSHLVSHTQMMAGQLAHGPYFQRETSCPALKSLVMINGTISAWMLLSLSLVVLSCGNGWWVKTWDMAENQNIELAVRLQWAAIILLHSNTVWNAQGSAHKPFLSWELKNNASLYLTIFGLLLCESLHPPSGRWEHSKEHCRELPSLALSFSCQNLSLPITGEKQSQAEAQSLGKPVCCSVRQWWGDMRMSAVRGWPSRFFLQASRWQLFYFFTYKFVFLLQCLAEREWSGLQRTSMQGKQGEVPLLPSLRLSSCPASAQWLWLLGEMVFDPHRCSKSALYKEELSSTRNKMH